MSIPLFLPAHLWRWTMRWSQADAVGNRNASRLGQSSAELQPEPCAGHRGARFQGSTCVNFDMDRFEWSDPWQLTAGSGSDGDKDREGDPADAEEDGEGPPFGPLPYSPFSPDRYRLYPQSAAFWSELSEAALRPHLAYFASFAELFGLLLATDSDSLRATSDAMSSWQRSQAQSAVNFWREAVLALLEAGAST
ncbi:unnamed protein product, partial [Polarella glacialis]